VAPRIHDIVPISVHVKN